MLSFRFLNNGVGVNCFLDKLERVFVSAQLVFQMSVFVLCPSVLFVKQILIQNFSP